MSVDLPHGKGVKQYSSDDLTNARHHVVNTAYRDAQMHKLQEELAAAMEQIKLLNDQITLLTAENLALREGIGQALALAAETKDD